MRGLIIGYGRAGQRHAQLCEQLGITVAGVDPVVEQAVFNKLGTALKLATYDFAIIATPPALHLEQIHACLEAGLPVLCEKPLCGLGQLDTAKALLKHDSSHRVMVAYNYRFHPLLCNLKRTQKQWRWRNGEYALFSDQYRPELPEWGLLLDHLSHGLDLLRWLTDERVSISKASHINGAALDSWFVGGMVGDKRFNLWDSTANEERDKRAYVSGPFGIQPVEYFDRMYEDMMRVFLAHVKNDESMPISLRDAIKTQELLEQVSRCQ